MSERAATEIIIIGGGIIGAATAYRLTLAGARVTLLDTGEPGRGTSGSSFAWLNSAHKPPRAYHDLNMAGMAEHVALGREFAAAPWLHPVGGLSWSVTSAGQAQLRADAACQRAWGYTLEPLPTERAIAELEPGLALDPAVVPELWYAPDEGWVDVPALIRRLLAHAVERGATIRPHATVKAIATVGDRATGVTLADGTALATDVIVNCAGPHADVVAALLGWELPLDRLPGLLAITGPTHPSGRCVCHADDITFRPDPGGGLVLAHAEDLDRTVDADTPLDPPPAACAEALDRAARAYPAVRAAGIAAARIGVRPLPRDGVSIVGRIPGYANAHIAVTHSGVTLGPLLGRLLAGEIMGGEQSAQLAPFRPERFAAVG
ncbi:MAG TPA: FAD-binding oxidoreductase [Thermomicrobiales bacterium]|jgi:glycine/D-amino acid oxidase-like deaminating enzyme